MTIFTILETLLIGPLKLIFEIIFEIAFMMIGHYGLAIIFLSLTMNILVLPLYRRADAMQEEVRDREAKLHDGVAHIKKTFSGDERMMILQTYYRQNNYKPTDALSGSISLLLEIPFFIAAYQFLSHLEVLQGVSFGLITDLSSPDGLLGIGGVSINLLPILMTLINVVSSALYLKGFPLKTKVQLYGMALIFLVFLYTSPAGLVFYWTLNNVFSLVKNIFYKLKNPQKILRILCAAVSLFLLVFGTVIYNTDSFKKRALVISIGLLLLLPIFLPILKKKVHFWRFELQPKPRLFLLGAIFMTILIGLLIPSALIADSPQDFIDITYFHNPLWYVVSSFCTAAGTFLIWMRVFYWLASPKIKRLFEYFVWLLCGVALVDYMFFGTDLGVINSNLTYENGMLFSLKQQLVNLLIVLVIAAALYFCACKWKNIAANMLIISIVTLSAMSVYNFVTIKTSVDETSVLQLSESEIPHFRLSTNGKNVIVLMLDRAMGGYIPYLFNEKPELKEQFDGFTYYENTISFGGHTNFATPALFGGYEYTPVELNKRSEESLVSKHNEALKVMPVVFSENGYEVTVCDPPYANYSNIPDMSIYNDCQGVTTYITIGQFSDETQKRAYIESNYRNFFCFSIMKSMPLIIQPTIYQNGNYFQSMPGVYTLFMNNYNVLMNLPNMTKITEDTTNTYLSLTNEATHRPIFLQEPDYIPIDNVDNSKYDIEHMDRFVIDGKNLKMKEEIQITHYHVNMAAMIQLGSWFDYLRENKVYDNTRIILVADHGFNTSQLDEFILGDDPVKDAEYYYPLLMVKDFNSKGFVTSETFMTNADVPTLATKEIIENPKNPFTGKIISDYEKNAHDQFVIVSEEWSVEKNNGNTFLPAAWAQINDNIWDKNNWTFYDELIILDEHSAP